MVGDTLRLLLEHARSSHPRVLMDVQQIWVAIFAIIDATSPLRLLTLCIVEIVICVDFLVNRLRGDLHLGVMHVPMKLILIGELFSFDAASIFTR